MCCGFDGELSLEMRDQLLVPGSLGFTGLTTALSGDFEASAPLAFRMLLTGGAIVAGMLFAGVVVPPPLDVPPMRRVGEK
jgi:uncharacterized membrane protein YjjB (DUF3815 family)